MEKLFYTLWRSGEQPLDSFNDGLIGNLAPALAAMGAKRVKVLVTDASVAEGEALRQIVTRPAVEAAVSFWLDAAHQRGDAETRVEQAGAAHAGFVVSESAALPNRQRVGGDGWCEGFNQLALIRRRGGADRGQWLNYWLEQHTSIAIETQSNHAYIQNVVVRPLGDHGRPWDGLVEESFAMPALTNRALFFDADGDPDKFRANVKRMMESCGHFIDSADVEVLITREYRHGGWRDGD